MTRRQRVPLVSVVMGVYNGASQLKATIDSILNQSQPSFEFIIVDDGSTDDSVAILENIASKDDRIIICRQSNAGLTQALIAGCRLAQGRFIARQDVGDRSTKYRLERQIEYLETHRDVVAVGAGCRRIGPGEEFLGESVRDLAPDQITQAFLHDGVGISHTVAMFRREAYERVGGYREEFRFAQDTDLWYRMSCIGKLGEVPEVLFEWGIDIDGISSTSHDRQRRLAMLAQRSHLCLARGETDQDVLREARETSWGDIPASSVITPRQALANAEFFIGSQLYAVGDPRCRRYLFRAIGQRPLWIRPWAKIALSFLRMPKNDV